MLQANPLDIVMKRWAEMSASQQAGGLRNKQCGQARKQEWRDPREELNSACVGSDVGNEVSGCHRAEDGFQPSNPDLFQPMRGPRSQGKSRHTTEKFRDSSSRPGRSLE